MNTREITLAHEIFKRGHFSLKNFIIMYQVRYQEIYNLLRDSFACGSGMGISYSHLRGNVVSSRGNVDLSSDGERTSVDEQLLSPPIKSFE